MKIIHGSQIDHFATIFIFPFLLYVIYIFLLCVFIIYLLRLKKKMIKQNLRIHTEEHEIEIYKLFFYNKYQYNIMYNKHMCMCMCI